MRKILCLLIIILLPSITFSQVINTLTQNEKKKGWILLFNGIDTKGWTTVRGQPVPVTGWEIKDGVLSTLKGGKGGDIVTINQYSDFDLKLDYKIEPGCNSGVKYFFTHMKPEETWAWNSRYWTTFLLKTINWKTTSADRFMMF